MKISKLLVLGTMVALLVMVPARPVSALDAAHSFDLTYRGAQDTVNGAIIYAFTPTDSTGTGYWHSFLRVSAANQSIVKGYNSDYKKKANVQFNEDPSWTESWKLADVPRVWVDGALYREFQLDINQNKSGTDALISIDQLQVWLTNKRMHDEKVDPYIVTYPFDANPDFHFVWGLDEVDDNVILLNFNLNPGSGKRDFKILVPDDLFDDSITYVVLYTEHGADAYTGDYDLDADPNTTGDVVSVVNTVFGNNDGFEEWGVAVYPCTDLSIDKTGTPGPICPGDDITYTLTVTNISTEPAQIANIVDTLPAGVTVTGVKVNGASTMDYSVDANNVLTYPAAGGFPLDAGQSITLEISATAPTDLCDGTLENSATVNVIFPEECDLTNNTDTASTTVQDVTAPVLPPLPEGGDLGCNPTPPSCVDDLVATDNCDGEVPVICTPGTITGDCDKSQTFTYSATDKCGNSVSDTVTYTWKADTTPPVLNDVPEDEDLGCNPTLPTCDAGVTATDNCDGAVDVTCTPGAITGDCDKSQTFTYSATDECGNTATDTVTYTWKEDTTPPVLNNVPEDEDLGCNPTPPTCDSGVTATDNCDGAVDVTCTPGEVVEDGCNRSQTFTYSAVDECGNEVSDSVTYTWKEDTTPPVLNGVPEDEDLGCNPTPPTCDAGVTATDNCDGEVPVSCTPGAITGDCDKSQTFTYSATDECGNTATDTVTYTWKDDTTPPVLNGVPADEDLGCNPTPPTCDAGVTATDNCDGAVDVNCTPGEVVEDGCNRSQTFTYSAVDECGNEVSDSVTYTWTVDITPPVITCPPAYYDRTGTCPKDPEVTGKATATDDCDEEVEITYSDSPHDDCGSVTRTWTATDDCGNSATCVQMIYCPCEDETACAAQTGPGETVFPDASNWFTYITYEKGWGTEASPHEYPIFAGQTHRSGTLFVYDKDNLLYVKYSIEGAADPEREWLGIREYHIQVEDTLAALIGAIVNEGGNPIPGQCEYKDNLGLVDDTGFIETDDISSYTDPIYIFAHSVMLWGFNDG